MFSSCFSKEMCSPSLPGCLVAPPFRSPQALTFLHYTLRAAYLRELRCTEVSLGCAVCSRKPKGHPRHSVPSSSWGGACV